MDDCQRITPYVIVGFQSVELGYPLVHQVYNTVKTNLHNYYIYKA